MLHMKSLTIVTVLITMPFQYMATGQAMRQKHFSVINFIIIDQTPEPGVCVL